MIEATEIELTDMNNLKPSNIILLAVAHKEFKALNKKDIKKLLKEDGCIYDLKNVYKKDYFNEDKIGHWKL